MTLESRTCKASEYESHWFYICAVFNVVDFFKGTGENVYLLLQSKSAKYFI